MPDTKKTDVWTTDIDSKYRLVLLAARRSKQLQKGAVARIQSGSKKTTRIALEEVERRMIRYERILKPVAAAE